MKKTTAAIIMTGFMGISFLAGCSSPAPETAPETTAETAAPDEVPPAEPAKDEDPVSENLVVYSPAASELITPLVNEFESRTGIKVEVIAAGTGELLKRVESEKENPLGDVFWTGTISTVKLQMDLFEEYRTPNEEQVQDDLKNVEGCLTRFTEMPSVLMVNTELAGDLEINGYADLLKPELKGRIALADPAKSSSAFEHIVNMLYAMGGEDPEDGWGYVEAFCENLDGKILNGSSAVVKGVADGEYIVGLSNEADGGKFVKDGAPVKLVYMEEGVISKPDGIYIIKGAKNLNNARLFLDYVTGQEAQSIVVEQACRRSVRKDVKEPDMFPRRADINLIYDDEDIVVNNKTDWLNKFHDIFTSF